MIPFENVNRRKFHINMLSKNGIEATCTGVSFLESIASLCALLLNVPVIASDFSKLKKVKGNCNFRCNILILSPNLLLFV